MSIIKSKHASNYTVLPNEIFSSGLSIEAIGLLSYFLSLPKDWVIYKTKLPDQLNIGREKLDRVFKDLQQAGYILSVKRQQESGRFEHEHIVYDKPYNGEPPADKPDTALPDMANQQLLNTNIQSTNEQNINILPEIDFNGLLKFINHNTGKQYKVINIQTKNKYNARLKDGYTKEQIMSAIINASKDAYHVETKFKYLTPEFFSRSTIIDKYGFSSTKENEETKPDTLMDWEWEAMLRNREEVRKIQAYAAKEK